VSDESRPDCWVVNAISFDKWFQIQFTEKAKTMVIEFSDDSLATYLLPDYS
jgi:hypothetical protein